MSDSSNSVCIVDGADINGLSTPPVLNPAPKRPQIRYKKAYREKVVQQNRVALFRAYCERAAHGARHRCIKWNLPHNIDADFVEGLLIAQEYRCAISGIPLDLPPKRLARGSHIPFGPSLDRIEPLAGYVRGNVRVTSTIANMAMHAWGVQALFKFIDAMNEPRAQKLRALALSHIRCADHTSQHDVPGLTR